MGWHYGIYGHPGLGVKTYRLVSSFGRLAVDRPSIQYIFVYLMLYTPLGDNKGEVHMKKTIQIVLGMNVLPDH